MPVGPDFTCAFPSSLCVFLHLVHDLSPPSASRRTFPCFCACLCVSSQPQGGLEGLVEGDWGCEALFSCCGFLLKTCSKHDGRRASENHRQIHVEVSHFTVHHPRPPTWYFLKQAMTQMPSFLSSLSPALCFLACVSGSQWTFWMRVNLWSLKAQGTPEKQR